MGKHGSVMRVLAALLSVLFLITALPANNVLALENEGGSQEAIEQMTEESADDNSEPQEESVVNDEITQESEEINQEDIFLEESVLQEENTPAKAPLLAAGDDATGDNGDWNLLRQQIQNAEDGAVIKLESDYTASDSDEKILTPKNKSITIDLNGHTLDRNKTSFDLQGQVIEVVVGSTLTIKDSSTAKTGTIKGGWAWTGGGITVGDSATLNLEGGTITGNKATSYNGFTGEGAGIRVIGSLNLNGGVVTGNEANGNGSGIFINDGATITVGGNPVVEGNKGTNLYLALTALIDIERLDAGANIGISREIDPGADIGRDPAIFTNGFESVMGPSDTPDTYFFADNTEYLVTKQNGEGYLMMDLNEAGKFLKRNERVNPNVEQLNSTNWMSGISGERYLNEINIPGTHDTAMNSLTEKGCPTGKIGKSRAKTQKQFIDEMLNDGVRFIDMRMNNKYCSKEIPIGALCSAGGTGLWAVASVLGPAGYAALVAAMAAYATTGITLADDSSIPIFKDDGKNLWACHGRDAFGGTFYALDHNGDMLSIHQELEWIKAFLKEHPTETVIIDARYETQDPEGDGPKILERFKGIIAELSQEKNPSTGDYYVYWEDGKVGEKFTHWPQLKDCRGKIVLWSKLPETADTIGGIWRDVDGIETKRPEGTYKDGEKRADNLKNFLNTYNTQKIPRNVTGEQMKEFYWIEMNTTDTSFIKTPVELADNYVNPVIFGSEGLVNESRKGDYLGWFGIDAGEASLYHDVWITNFPADLDYCTITVKYGLGDAVPDQVYKVLRGTPITIPGCIYDGDQANKFAGWKENLENKIYIMNNTYTVEENVAFTAQWAGQIQTPVTVVWKDADNLDNIRPEQLSISYNSDYREVIKAESDWTIMLSGDLTDDPAVTSVPAGYTVKVEGQKGKDGYTITMIHTPDVSVNASGRVTWDDENNKDGIRPDSVTLKLYKNGGETPIETGTATAEGNWEFNLGTFPRYEDGELVAYKLVEDEINVADGINVSGYSNGVETIEGEKNAITGFKVTNTHEAATSVIYAQVDWDDDNNAAGKRPESVTVQWMKGDEAYGEPIVVTPDEDGNWTFSLELTYVEMQTIANEQDEIAAKYPTDEMTDETAEEFIEEIKNTFSFTILQNEIDGYTTEVSYKTETGDDDKTGGYYQVLNTYKNHQHKLTKTEAKDTTCTKAGNTAYWTCDQGDDACWKYFSDAEGTTEIEEDSWIIPAKGHDLVHHEGQEATCTEKGWKDYDTCSRCDYTTYEETAAIGHDWEFIEFTWIEEDNDPNMFTGVVANYKCKNDEKHMLTVDAAVTTEETDPTCEKAGKVVLTATVSAEAALDGATRTDSKIIPITALGHDWDETIETTDGVHFHVTRTCNRCGKVIEYDYDEGGHVHDCVRVAGTPATCEESGVKEHVICVECGRLFTGLDCGEELTEADVVIPAMGHDWGKVSYTWSDDNSSAMATRVCANDGSHKETETVQTKSEVTKQPTCTEAGETTYTAAFTSGTFGKQKKTVKDIPIDHDAHDWGEWKQTKEPACTEPGTETRVCSRDDSHTESREVAALGHDWDETIETIDGVHFHVTRTCNRCGKVIEYDYDEGGHVHDCARVAGTPATCEESGVKEHVICVECGRLFTGLDYGEELTEADVVIPALEHDWSEWKVTKTPTCVSEGESERVCKRDASHTETVKEAADPYAHKWGKASYTWSDDYSEVTAERICQNDKTHKQTENVQTISEVTKAATCTKKGKITYTATFKETHDDGFVFETQEKKADIPATGHDWGEWVVTKEPTEKQKGEEIRTCKNDPSHTEKRDIPEKDHQHRPKKMEEKDSVNAKDGNIDCWVCDCGRYFTDPEGENEIEEDVVFFHYFCTDGDGNHWTRGGNAFFTFIFKRSVEDGETFSRFLGILIDGISVDKKYYTAEKGSVIVRIDPEYMETLAGGEHKLTAVFTDGTDDAVFKIVGADTPATGDNNHTVIWIIVMAASFLGLLILFITAERKYRKRQ